MVRVDARKGPDRRRAACRRCSWLKLLLLLPPLLLLLLLQQCTKLQQGKALHHSHLRGLGAGGQHRLVRRQLVHLFLPPPQLLLQPQDVVAA